ncbi:transporter [Mycolicibacterium fortuitum]|uniref:Transporter n=1 Tax=Mycolicibacterium fortuitum TaxID=1766 RepID=A0ABD6QTN1_MYCFO|nr:transporter [Mycolicibacterium fortuitum]OMC51439.1 transporter [Mycolicibacterium fortuitum]
MIEILFMIAVVWAIVVGFTYGIKFIRGHHNYLLGLEWIVVATSCTNFMVFAAIKAGHDSPMYTAAAFLDAFSRSFGITLVLVLGLMQVTHRYKPSLAVEIGAFALAAVGGFVFLGYQESSFKLAAETFLLVANLLTSCFLAYFCKRLWDIGEHRHAIWSGVATMFASFIAITYDFFPIPEEDMLDRPLFYTLALAAWGLQMFTYYRAYTAFDAYNKRAGTQVTTAPATA